MPRTVCQEDLSTILLGQKATSEGKKFQPRKARRPDTSNMRWVSKSLGGDEKRV